MTVAVIYFLLSLSSLPASEPVQDGRVKARLKMDEGWHVYWQNPDDSGIPPEITWKIPDGFQKWGKGRRCALL